MQVILFASLVAVAIGYGFKSRDELTRAQVAWAVVLAGVGFALPLVVNHVMDSDFLHRLHKLLAFVVAFVVFVACIAALRYRTRRRSPES